MKTIVTFSGYIIGILIPIFGVQCLRNQQRCQGCPRNQLCVCVRADGTALFRPPATMRMCASNMAPPGGEPPTLGPETALRMTT